MQGSTGNSSNNESRSDASCAMFGHKKAAYGAVDTTLRSTTLYHIYTVKIEGLEIYVIPHKSLQMLESLVLGIFWQI